MLNRLLGQEGSRPVVEHDYPGSLFKQMTRCDCRLRAAVHMRVLRRGEHLFRPEDTLAFVYLIYTGAIKTYRLLFDCSERIRGFHFAGELLALDALFARPLRHGAVALTSATVFPLPVGMVFDHIVRCHETRTDLLMHSRDEIIALEEVLSLQNLHAEERLGAFILWVADKLSSQGSQGTLSLPMSRKDIGNYLGVAPETVSRLLARFEELQLVSVKRSDLTVQDLQKLKDYVAGLPTRTACDIKRSGNCGCGTVQAMVPR